MSKAIYIQTDFALTNAMTTNVSITKVLLTNKKYNNNLSKLN